MMGRGLYRCARESLHAISALLILGACAASSPSGAPADIKAIEKAAHDGYVAAINSNDVDTLMAVMTDDIVYQAPGAPEVVGKAAVWERIAG